MAAGGLQPGAAMEPGWPGMRRHASAYCPVRKHPDTLILTFAIRIFRPPSLSVKPASRPGGIPGSPLPPRYRLRAARRPAPARVPDPLLPALRQSPRGSFPVSRARRRPPDPATKAGSRSGRAPQGRCLHWPQAGHGARQP